MDIMFSQIGYRQNLQPRSFALARWQLREILFGFNHKPPEDLNPQDVGLLFYMLGLLGYRFFIFLGNCFSSLSFSI